LFPEGGGGGLYSPRNHYTAINASNGRGLEGVGQGGKLKLEAGKRKKWPAEGKRTTCKPEEGGAGDSPPRYYKRGGFGREIMGIKQGLRKKKNYG